MSANCQIFFEEDYQKLLDKYAKKLKTRDKQLKLAINDKINNRYLTKKKQKKLKKEKNRRK